MKNRKVSSNNYREGINPNCPVQLTHYYWYFSPYHLGSTALSDGLKMFLTTGCVWGFCV